MLTRITLGLAVAFSAALALTATAADEAKKEAAVLCPVSGKPIDKTKAADYKGGQVYFCCENCPKAFAKDTAKFAPKANAQFVATKQAEQVKCPISGAKFNPEKTLAVNGVDVRFCCDNCKGKVEKAEKAEQVNLVFGDKAFEKAYEVKKEKK